MSRPSDGRALRDRAAGAARRRLGVDARSLAAFRIALGVLILADLALRSRNLAAFYTDFGVLPRAAYLSQADPLHWSFHVVSGDARVQALLFLIAGVFAAALTIGYRTSIATVGSWLFLVSLHNRMPDALNGGDFLLRLLLFWAMFLPLGARWAVDSRHGARARSSGRVASVATAALLSQVVLMYATNAVLKLSGRVWLAGDGLKYAFSLGQFTVLLGDRLGAYPALLHAFDYLWLGAIALSPLLVVLWGRWRTGLAALLASMHVGMLLTMRLDLFPLVCIAGLLPFLPAWFWDRATPLSARLGPSETVRRRIGRLADALPTVTVSGVPPRLRRWKARFATVVPLAFLVLIVLWNVQFVGLSQVGGHDVLPESAESAMDVTRTDQYWNMFAPDPLSTDGWVVVSGELENGTRVDAFRGGPVNWDRPADVSETYPTARWRKYLVGLWRYGGADRRHFAAYLCRQWNAEREPRLENVSVHFVEQPTRIDGGDEPTESVRLADRRCPR